MLGMEIGDAHTKQNQIAVKALKFTPAEIETCAKRAFERASVLPLKNPLFNLATDLAEQAGLRFTELLFGFGDLAYPYLQGAMRIAYTQLVFQIIGRHFVPEFRTASHRYAGSEGSRKEAEERDSGSPRQPR